MVFPWFFPCFSPLQPRQSPPRRPRSCPWAPEWIGPRMPGDVRMEKMVIFGGILPWKIGSKLENLGNFTMENWKNMGNFGGILPWKIGKKWEILVGFYHGKLEKNGKFWCDFTMENWKKLGNFGGILAWKIGKNW